MRRVHLGLGLMVALMAIGMQSFATVWRVNAAPGASANYTSLQAAHDAVTTLAGDTIYLEGSPFSTGGLTCTKKLIIIGSGYFLGENPQTQANTNPSTVDYYTYFNAGSEGSKIMGCRIQYSIYLSANDITIERNYFPSTSNAIYGYYSAVNNIKILDNYFEGYYYWNNVTFSTTATNILISNNYFAGSISTTTAFSGFLINNIFGYSATIYNSTLSNNIMIDGYFTPYNCIYNNNIGNSTQFGDQNGNQQNVVMSTVFQGLTGNSTDGQWKLKAGSPAIGAGEGGVDCGIYGGAHPYILSGMPAIPSVYYFNAPSLPTNTINVSIKAKSHN